MRSQCRKKETDGAQASTFPGFASQSISHCLSDCLLLLLPPLFSPCCSTHYSYSDTPPVLQSLGNPTLVSCPSCSKPARSCGNSVVNVFFQQGLLTPVVGWARRIADRFDQEGRRAEISLAIAAGDRGSTSTNHHHSPTTLLHPSPLGP